MGLVRCRSKFTRFARLMWTVFPNTEPSFEEKNAYVVYPEISNFSTA